MTFVGVDGCKGKWLAVTLTDKGGWRVDVFPDIRDLWNAHDTASLICIDIPIGLPGGGEMEEERQERLCDVETRKLIGRRGRSVFRVPCRKAVVASDHGHTQTSKINKATTGKGLSCQTFCIIPKIKEVDSLLLQNTTARQRIREVHPELCFWVLAGGHPMEHKKKTEEGFQERKQVLQSVCAYTTGILNYALSNWRRSEVGRDDILDAIAAAVTAYGGVHGLDSIPERPEYDAKGLRMEMVYREFKQ